MKLGDLFLSLRGDSQQLIADATKGGEAAGDKAAETFGEKFKAGAMKALTVGLAGAFAFATKRLVELDNAVAKFTADTGASAEEAKAAGKAINDMAGRNLQPIAEIGNTLAAVTTNMGLQGQAAVDLTEKILRYATVTGQDAVEATAVADDLMDRYKLTASDLSDVMDALVANTQRHGGSVKVQQQALADLQPVLDATNASWQDGVTLLGFFEQAGVDSASATAGLLRAVKLLKPGQSIQDLFDQVSAIGPAADRTKEAVRLFGRGAGPQLAAALGDGKVSLKDLALTAEETAGSVDTAASAIKGTLVNQIRLGLSNAASAVAGFLAPAGPLLTAVASLTTLLAPVLGKAFGSAPAKAAAAAAGTKIAAVFGRAVLIGEKVTAAVMTVWQMVPGNAAISGALSRAGSLMGSKLGKIIGVAAIIGIAGSIDSKMIHDAILGTSAGGPEQEAARAQAQQEAFAAATLAVTNATLAERQALFDSAQKKVVAGEALTFKELVAVDQAGGTVTQAIRERAISTWVLTWLRGGEDAAAALGTGFEGGAAALDGTLGGVIDKVAADAKARTDRMATLLGLGFPEAVADAWSKSAPSLEEAARFMFSAAGATVDDSVRIAAAQAAGFGQAWIDSMLLQYPHLTEAASGAGGAVAQGLDQGAPKVAASATGLIETAAAKMLANAQKWRDIGKGIPSGIGRGMAEASQLVNTAMDDLLWILENGLTPGEQAARVMGKKYGQNLTKGLHSTIPGAQQQAKEVGIAAIVAIEEAPGKGKTKTNRLHRAGEIYGELVGSGMTSTQIDVALRAAHVSEAAIAALHAKDKKDEAKRAGADLGNSATSGVNSVDGKPAGSALGVEVAGAIDSLQAQSMAMLAAAALVRVALSYVGSHPVHVNVQAPTHSPNVPSGGGNTPFAGAGLTAGGGSTSTSSTTNIVNVAGLVRAQTPEDIGRVLRRTAALGLV